MYPVSFPCGLLFDILKTNDIFLEHNFSVRIRCLECLQAPLFACAGFGLFKKSICNHYYLEKSKMHGWTFAERISLKKNVLTDKEWNFDRYCCFYNEYILHVTVIAKGLYVGNGFVQYRIHGITNFLFSWCVVAEQSSASDSSFDG